MAQQLISSVENNFTKGLVTEFTGLNFPENAATSADNTEFTLIGDTLRRLGVDYEANAVLSAQDRTNKAINTYKWNNVGGDGSTQILVTQVGATLSFYKITTATTASPLSDNKLASTVTVSSFVASGGSFDATQECTFADGNGYLFVFHPSCDPIYCNYNAGTITGNSITIKTRDFIGCIDNLAVNTRQPTATLTGTHFYNILNQGWVSANAWAAATAVTNVTGVGIKVFTTTAGLVINPGDLCASQLSTGAGYTAWAGTVTAYVGTALTINITSFTGVTQFGVWGITSVNTDTLGTWVGSQGNYPSNADQWWTFKNTLMVFDPTTQASRVLGSGPAPKGHYILYEFNQDRQSITGSGITLNKVTTLKRPSNGTWFQGRIWYTGVNSSQQALSDVPFYSWSENIYFSQVCLSGATNFGDCFQVNDPTAEDLFDLLPTDGGVINIQGSGPIYRLFPIQNGMLVFAANGVWFITGTQGIGFAANDYTITKLSSTQSISSTSYVDVQGLPFFWNEEGIYQVSVDKGNVIIDAITIGTILSFYNEIPLEAKKYARGAYHPTDYSIQWVYKSSDSASVRDRYSFNKILNFNTHNKAFYPYTVDITSASINSINYISGPGGVTTLPPVFKYFCSNAGGSTNTFAELRNTSYVDWNTTGSPVSFDSTFTTGYKLHGKALNKFQVPYIYVYNRMNDESNSYYIQSCWDYANTGNSGRWSQRQFIEIFSPMFDVVFRRPRIPGRGLSLQLKFTSVPGKPFDIIGWAMSEAVNTGV